MADTRTPIDVDECVRFRDLDPDAVAVNAKESGLLSPCTSNEVMGECDGGGATAATTGEHVGVAEMGVGT